MMDVLVTYCCTNSTALIWVAAINNDKPMRDDGYSTAVLIVT